MDYRFPMGPYPYGWYQVLLSRDIKRKEIKTVEYFNKSIVVFRGESGTVSARDAYCPHLGAHVGVGGKVVGDTIQCPFHGWRFDHDGQCVDIPYCAKIPPKAKFEMYPTQEINGAIFIYYDEQGEAPKFDLPVMPEFSDPNYSKLLHWNYEVDSHVQEMAENALDMGHFPLVHDYKEVPRIESLICEGAALHVRFLGERRLLGVRNPFDVTLDCYGLGVVFGRNITDLVTVRVIHSATPINENKLRIGVSFVYQKSKIPGLNLFLRWFLPKEVVRFVDGDRAILNHKMYREKPKLCSAERPLMVLRRWAKQFYRETGVEEAAAA